MQCQLQYILASVLCKHCPSGMDMHMRVYSRIVVCKRCGYTYTSIELNCAREEGRGGKEATDGWERGGWGRGGVRNGWERGGVRGGQS